MVENLPQTIAALLLVLSVIFAGGYVLRRISNAMPNPAGRPSDLKVVEWRGLDSRRKLAVVRWDEKEHLLCLGPGGDTIVASRDAPAIPTPPPVGANKSTSPAQPNLAKILGILQSKKDG